MAIFCFFVGPEAYNKYSHALSSNAFIYLAEFVLVVFILIHAILALGLKIRSFRTNPTPYAVDKFSSPKTAPLSSRSMAYTGLAILGFLIWHIATFKYGPEYYVTYDGQQMRDLYTLVDGAFQNTTYVILYILSMFFVGVHLYHGVKASFQTFGLLHPRYNAFIKYFGRTYAIVVAVGFIALPVYFFLR